MQKMEEENSKSVIEAAGGDGANGGSAAKTPASKPVLTAAPVHSSAEANPPVKGTGIDPNVNPAKSIGASAPEVRSLENASSIPVSHAAASPAAPAPNPPAPAAEQPPAAVTPVVAEPQHITIDDFVKVDLRVAQILVAERVPKADKLLRLEVDLGYEKRQILAGIAQYYEPEKLVGRKIVVVANLAPRKMRGLESNGMLLAASLPDGAPVLAGFLEEVPLGARLK
jgi:methionyl-tRNA synthetase